MTPYSILLSKNFQKDLLKLISKNPSVKEKITKVLLVIQTNPRHPSLRLHKLVGIDHWSISVDLSIRIIMMIDGNNIYLLRIGSHDQVY